VAATNRPDWGRYVEAIGRRLGRLKNLCPECDADYAARRNQAEERNRVAAAAGYNRGWSSTPEYNRLQRELNAAKEGRTLEAYIPQAERERIGRMVDADKYADRLRARWMREWLAPFRKSDRELYRTDPEYRERQKAHYREHYRRHRHEEVARVAAYKRAHADRNLEWTFLRKEREAILADGTASHEAIAQLKREARHCAYCRCALFDKQTDHMIPLVLGGEHSLRNIVIVCPTCNGRKGRLSYEEWIDRVDAQHRARLLALYRERYGEAVAA
jgi:5-methylcytosine-specific restriction endonuclease McrA